MMFCPVVSFLWGGEPASADSTNKELTFLQAPVGHMYEDVCGFIYDFLKSNGRVSSCFGFLS